MKYKLIKTYPNSPELGTIAEKRYGSYTILDNSSCALAILQVENYPEFWEKIEDLCVPAGTKFKVKGHHEPDIIYIIKSINNLAVTISWIKNNEKETTIYSLNRINEYFKKGTWIIYDELLDKKCLSINEVTTALFNYLGDNHLENITKLLKRVINEKE